MSYEKNPFGRGMSVEVRENNIEKALKILKKKMANESVLKDLKRHQEYEKPSEKKRRRHAEAVRRNRKKTDPDE